LKKLRAKTQIGLIINPIAGIGGTVGLKGSDGSDILQHARELGGEIHAPRRAREFLGSILELRDHIEIVSLPGIMGGDLAQEMGFAVHLLLSPSSPAMTEIFKTVATDTIDAAIRMKQINVSLLLFVGGDGTARDIFKAVGTTQPCLGIPAGVKVHSSVFATGPVAAGKLVNKFLEGEAPLREAEVLDIDEDAFRDNRVVSKLYGYLQTPYSPTLTQPSKVASPHTDHEHNNQRRIAEWVINQMEGSGKEWYYLLGPGTTTRAIAMELEQPKTLLGVDLYFHKKLIAQDLNEQQLLDHIKERDVILVVTPIGAQGFIFGRGNLQLSPKVLRKIGLKNIILIGTKFKISTLPHGKLRIDSRDVEFDRKFSGLHRILVDYGEFKIIDVEN